MTVVEFFGHTPIKNILTSLSIRPDKIIFVGPLSQVRKYIGQYYDILRSRGIKTKIEVANTDCGSVKEVSEVITRIVQTEQDCIFDITGGEDMTLFAMGTVYERLRGKYKFNIQHLDTDGGNIADCDGDGAVSSGGDFSLSISELVSLFGGKISSRPSIPEDKKYHGTVDTIWDIAKEEPKMWNESMSAFKTFEKHAVKGGININSLKSKIQNYDRYKGLFFDLAKKLSDAGLIRVTDTSLSHYAYTYRDEFTKSCLNKAGDILEMKVLNEVGKLKDGDTPYFNDCAVGVSINWDGTGRNYEFPDTVNEIDVMAMRGITPLFISCKNGDIDEAELYKLNTVALRFGGIGARKILIATDFSRPSVSSKKAFLARAHDMRITVIPCARELHGRDWENVFKNVIERQISR